MLVLRLRRHDGFRAGDPTDYATTIQHFAEFAQCQRVGAGIDTVPLASAVELYAFGAAQSGR